MTQLELASLKPCPWCGYANCAVSDGNNGVHFRVICGKGSCRATGPLERCAADAIAAWNHRAADHLSNMEICDLCNGSGVGVADTVCSKCDGAGGYPCTADALSSTPEVDLLNDLRIAEYRVALRRINERYPPDTVAGWLAADVLARYPNQFENADRENDDEPFEVEEIKGLPFGPSTQAVREALEEAREAIAQADEDAFGEGVWGHNRHGEPQTYPLRDELLAKIDAALSIEVSREVMGDER